jgi:hypothetical protein
VADPETTPRRVQRSRTKGWKMPEGAIYVGRPTKWGNPFAGNGGASWRATAVEAVQLVADFVLRPPKVHYQICGRLRTERQAITLLAGSEYQVVCCGGHGIIFLVLLLKDLGL